MTEVRTYYITLTSAISVAGKLKIRDDVVPLDEPQAKDLLRRGKGRLATDAEIIAAGYEQAPVAKEPEPEQQPQGKPSDGLTVAQLKEALAAKGVEIPAGTNTKAELAALLDEQPE